MGSGSISASQGSGGSGFATVSWTLTTNPDEPDYTHRTGLQWYVNGSAAGGESTVAASGSASISASHGSSVRAQLTSYEKFQPTNTEIVLDSYSSPSVTVTSAPPSPPPSPGAPTVTAVPVSGQIDTWDITVTGTGNRKRIYVIEDGVQRQIASSSSTGPLTFRYTKPAGKTAVAARGEQWNFFNSWDGASATDATTIQVTFGGIGWGFRL